MYGCVYMYMYDYTYSYSYSISNALSPCAHLHGNKTIIMIIIIIIMIIIKITIILIIMVWLLLIIIVLILIIVVIVMIRFILMIIYQLSIAQSGRGGPAPGSFEPSEGAFRSAQATALCFEPLASNYFRTWFLRTDRKVLPLHFTQAVCHLLRKPILQNAFDN